MSQYPPDPATTGAGLPPDGAGSGPARHADPYGNDTPGGDRHTGLADDTTVVSTSYVDPDPLGTRTSGADDPSTGGGTADVAKEQAGQVKDTAVSAGQDVAATAKDEARNVVGEAKDQAVSLLDQAKSEAGTQVGSQQQRVAGLLSGYADELKAMVSGEQSSGPVTDLARQGADKAREYASWLEHREPADILDEIRSFARRRPVAFLVGAALAGVVAGRATCGFAANAKAEKDGSRGLVSGSTDHDGSGTGYTGTARPASLVDEVPTSGPTYPAASTIDTGTTGGDPLNSSYDPLDEPRVGRQDDVIR